MTKFLCPRRGEVALPTMLSVPQADEWRGEPGRRTCSWCGSRHPDEFMAQAAEGAELSGTDKNYKVYIGAEHSKFYFQHLSEEQRQAFVDLMNQGKLKFSPMGHFYVLPFFIKRKSP